METLTKKEEEIMQILWKIKKGFVKEIINRLPEPKPPYNTISSIVRILEKKGFVTYKTYGKTHEYFPQISKAVYKKHTFKKILTNYFDGSYEKIVSFMVKEQEISGNELDEIKQLIENIDNNSE